MLGGVWCRWRITDNLHGAVIARGGKEFVCWVKGDTLDVALVNRERLELLKSVARPNDNLGIKADRDKNGRVGRPGEVLHVVFMADKTLVRLPVFDWGRL